MTNVERVEVKPPWYSVAEVPCFLYRVNRRPRAQGSLLASSDPSFIDHLTEVLLMGSPVTTGTRYQREWLLGNREIDASSRYLSGWVGYDTEGLANRDRFDPETKSWVTDQVTEERTAKAPFAISAETRLLAVAKHPTFAPGSVAKVFDIVLNLGENSRLAPAAEWAVEPLLDEPGFDEWLAKTAILERVTFTVKVPNPDAAESFAELAQHLSVMDAEVTHVLRPQDPARGLNKDFQQDPISQGLIEMARRSFATVRAKGKSVANKVREYDQKERVRRGRVQLPEPPLEAQQALGEYVIRQDAPGSSS